MHHPLAPERIARDLPGVKLIVLLRDPVVRAYSAHKHELARGFETEPFERALDLEPERLAGEVEKIKADPGYVSHGHRHHSYLDRGQYADQIERLFELFGRERVLVLYAEDFILRARALLRLRPGLPRAAAVAARVVRAAQRPARVAAAGPSAAPPGRPLRPWDDKLAALLGAEPAWRR